MKKTIMIVMALAMVAVFLPKAQAADSANLGLQVTFAQNEPLKIWSEPQGPFKIEAGKTLEFKVIAEDRDATSVDLSSIALPEGAEFILAKYLVGTNHKEGLFRWTPKSDTTSDTMLDALVVAIFGAHSYGEGSVTEKAELKVEITVTVAPVISIELDGPNPWVLDGVKLGERRNNNYPDSSDGVGLPMHQILNKGNIPVMVDIGYGLMAMVLPRPGLEQGVDTYITICNDTVIPPNGRVKIANISPGLGYIMPLVYGAPMALSSPVQGMGTCYEVRAYGAKDIGPIEPPIVEN